MRGSAAKLRWCGWSLCHAQKCRPPPRPSCAATRWSRPRRDSPPGGQAHDLKDVRDVPVCRSLQHGAGRRCYKCGGQRWRSRGIEGVHKGRQEGPPRGRRCCAKQALFSFLIGKVRAAGANGEVAESRSGGSFTGRSAKVALRGGWWFDRAALPVNGWRQRQQRRQCYEVHGAHRRCIPDIPDDFVEPSELQTALQERQARGGACWYAWAAAAGAHHAVMLLSAALDATSRTVEPSMSSGRRAASCARQATLSSPVCWSTDRCRPANTWQRSTEPLQAMQHA
mgnify:CR=1 FL=1